MIVKKLLCLLLTTLLIIPASAIDYTFEGVTQADFYPSTSYESVYGSAYNYGGTNVVDYIIPDLAYGLSTPSIGILERYSTPTTVTYATTSAITTPTTVLTTTVTQYTETSQIVQSDNSIGTLKIPAIGVTTKVYADESDSSMEKGVGHFTSTSVWDGNVGICGHNRGTSYVFYDLKDLEIGDEITYTTELGTRTYAVTLVTQISSTDWSYLSSTVDNRLTLITCVENQSSLRWCVQAVEI